MRGCISCSFRGGRKCPFKSADKSAPTARAFLCELAVPGQAFLAGCGLNRRAEDALLLALVPSRLLPKFHAGFLYFAVRQKPDKRFVMKIDNLDTIAPGIAEIA